MPIQVSVIRLLLVALMCAGFCGLQWTQLRAAPVVTTRGQIIIQETQHGDSRLFATSEQESLRSVGQPERAEVAPFVFDDGKESTVVPPVFAVVANADAVESTGQSALKESKKNKDPPVL